MIKEARKMYERYRNEGNLPARAVRILNEQGKTTPRSGKIFTDGNIRPYFQEKYNSLVVDVAIIQAGKEYEAEQRALLEEAKTAALEEV